MLFGWSIYGCFNEEFSTPSNQESFEVINVQVKTGQVSSGLVYDDVRRYEYNNYFINLGFDLELVARAQSHIVPMVYAQAAIANTLGDIQVKCVEGRYTSDGVGAVIDQVLSIEFDQKRYSLAEFNNLPASSRKLKDPNVRIFLNEGPIQSNFFVFEVSFSLDGVTQTIKAPRVSLI